MKRLALLLALFGTTAANAAYLDVPCPPPQPNEPPGCKIITLTPFEQNALVGPNQILDTARQGRPLDLTNATEYFRQKLDKAPAGKTFEVKQPDAPAAGAGAKEGASETKPAIHMPPKPETKK